MFRDPHPDLLRPVRSDDFLPPISLWTTLGGLFLVGTVGSAITLAAIIKYNVTVKARATVRPTGETRIVQAAAAGTVKSILVQENQLVKQGDALATIDNSQLQTKKSQLLASIENDQRQLVQIAAQLNSLDKQRESEFSLMNRTIASAAADLSRNQREYKNRRITTQTEVQAAQAALELARVELKQYQQLGNTGAIAQLQIKEKEQAFKVALAKLERTLAALNPSAAPVAIATERVAQERARGSATLATLNKEREELLRRQVEMQNHSSRDTRELQQIQSDLNKSVVKAPEAGTILKLDLRNQGQVVEPGDAIAQIAPSHAALVVKARVAAGDIGNVRVCKQRKVSDCEEGRVHLRVSAYPYPDYGTLKGAVRAIAPDAISGASAVAPYYEVTIQPEKLHLVKSDRSYPITSGMEVTADIVSREDTVLTFILRKARLLTDL